MARGLQVKYVHSAVVCKRSHMVALPCVHLKRDCKLRVGFALLMRTSDHQSRRPAKWDGEDRHPCPSSLNVGVGHFSGGGGSEFRGSEKKLAWIRPDICLDLCQFDISSSYHQLCGILPLPQPTLHCFCLLLFVFFPLLPPLLKFCLAHRHWPLLAQSWDRRREHTNAQEPVPVSLLCGVCAKHSSCLADEETRRPTRYFLACASYDNLSNFVEGFWQSWKTCMFWHFISLRYVMDAITFVEKKWRFLYFSVIFFIFSFLFLKTFCLFFFKHHKTRLVRYHLYICRK